VARVHHQRAQRRLRLTAAASRRQYDLPAGQR
jgi:hypothetical protein